MPSADERLAAINIKVERAKKHIVDLDLEVNAFLASKPYGIVKQIDPQSGKHRYEVSSIEEILPQIAAIFGDAVQNLRSALDHLSNQLLLVGLGVDQTTQEFNFPIYGDEGRHKAVFQGPKPAGLRADAWAALEALKAYKEGKGNDFWALNRVNNIDKHRLVLAVGSANRSVNLGALTSRQLRRQELPADWPYKASDIPILDAFFRPADTQCPLTIGDILVDGLTEGMEMDPDKDFRFDVAINEPKVMERKPLIETAQHFADLVGATVRKFRPCLA